MFCIKKPTVQGRFNNGDAHVVAARIFVDNGQLLKILTIDMQCLLFAVSTLKNCRIIYKWISLLNDQYYIINSY